MDLMNFIFREYLYKFIIIFIDDILIYFSDYKTHVIYLRMVLEILHEYQLCGKISKYGFWFTKIAFFIHVISIQGVAIDSGKIEVLIN